MSSLLKPSTRSLSTFRPQSLFSLCLFLPHTRSLSLKHFLLRPASLCCTKKLKQSIYCSLSLSPTHTRTRKANMYIHMHSNKLQNILKLLPPFPISLLSSRNKELHKCQLSVVSPKPTKESACARPFNKADGCPSIQPSKPNPFTPNLQHRAGMHTHFYTHTGAFLPQWPPSDLSPFVANWQTFQYSKKEAGT